MSLSNDDSILIEKSILLLIVKAVLEKDLETINAAPFKLKTPYVQLIERSLQSVSLDIKHVKRDLFKKGIKIAKVRNDGTHSEYEYLCRGDLGKVTYLNHELRDKTKQSMENYFMKKAT